MASAEDWNPFRGPDQNGASEVAGIPLTWSAGENRLWKLELPGPGTSQPVVWNDRIYVTCYSGYGYLRGKHNYTDVNTDDQSKLMFHVVCVDARTGTKVWQKDFTPLGGVTEPNSNVALHGYASPSPFVDADGLFVSFGTGGIFALDPATGEPRWRFVPGTIAHILPATSSKTTMPGPTPAPYRSKAAACCFAGIGVCTASGKGE
jgi:hypothetical protein